MSFGEFAANLIQRVLDRVLPERWAAIEVRETPDPWAIIQALSMRRRELENEVRHLRQDNRVLQSRVASLDAQAALWRRFISMPRGRFVGRNAEGFWQLWLHPSPSSAGWDLQDIGYDPVDVVDAERPA